MLEYKNYYLTYKCKHIDKYYISIKIVNMLEYKMLYLN